MLGKQAFFEEEIAWEDLKEENSQTQVRDVLTGMGVSRTELALKLHSLSVVCFVFGFVFFCFLFCFFLGLLRPLRRD